MVWPLGGPKMADVFGRSSQLSLNDLFDPSTPSMRKVNDGGEAGGKTGKITLFIVAPNVTASRPPKHQPTRKPTAHANLSFQPP